MSRFRITQPARDDLLDIFQTIAQSSPTAATRMNDRFTRLFRELATSPELGRFVEEFQPGMRRANEGVYGVFYREAENEIQILRVIHCNRDIAAQFRR